VDVKYVFKLPLRFAEENRTDHSTLEDFPVTASIRLFERTARVDVAVTIENGAKNHRVEVRIPTGLSADHVQVDGSFCTNTRAAHYDQTAAMHRFLDVNDGEAGLAVLSRGIYEYNLDRAADGGIIADLTLLRCVGVLAGHHIGNRWPANSAPEAQVPGTTIAEFALVPHSQDAVEGNVHRFGAEFCAPPRAIEPLEHLYLRGKCEKTLPAGEHSFVELTPNQLELTAFHKDENKDIAYLRFYNTGQNPCEAHLSVAFGKELQEVLLVDIKGDSLLDQQSLQFECGSITLLVRPAQIVTLAMQF
jgi:alpha-mannosidase